MKSSARTRLAGVLIAAAMFIVPLIQALVACDLPLDPYTVGLPKDLVVGSGPWTGQPESQRQFAGFINTPGDNADGLTGFVVIDSRTPITWAMYYDPTQGGKNNKNLKFTNGYTGAHNAFYIRQTQAPVKLFDMTVASAVLQAAFKANMAVSEIYQRNPAIAPWNQPGHRQRVFSPWEIPSDMSDIPTRKGAVMTDDGAGNSVRFAPALTVTPAYTPDAGLYDRSDGATNQVPAAGDIFLTDLFGNDGMSPPSAGLDLTATATAQTFWRVQMTPNPPQWPDPCFGYWNFDSVTGDWAFDTKDTAWNPTAEIGSNPEQVFDFLTPSEPFFYRVKPKARFKFTLTMPAGNEYVWTEEQMSVTQNPSGTWVQNPTGATRTYRLAAGGPIEKNNEDLDGGVATLVMVRDKLGPFHSHLMNPTNIQATVGKKLTGSMKVVAVDDNPYGAYTGGYAPITPTPGVTPPSPPGLFDPAAKLKGELYYTTQVEDYSRADLEQWLGGKPADFGWTAPEAGWFPFHQERFVWFKKDLNPDPGGRIGPIAPGGAAAVGAMTMPYGSGGNPAFSLATFTVNGADMDQPAGLHHGDGSLAQTYADAPDGYKDFQNRIKFFVRPIDGSGFKAPMAGFETPETILPKSVSAEKGFASATANAPIEDEGGTPIPSSSTPPWDYRAAVNAAGAGVCDPGAHPPSQMGQMGFVTPVADSTRPSVMLLVRDTKYDKTYVVNDSRQGWWAHASAQSALAGAPPAKVTAPDFNIGLETLVDSDSDGAIMFNQGGWGDATANFATQLSDPNWTPYDRASNTRRGIWVDEDTRLVFMPVAFDNINWRTPIDIASGDVDWRIEDNTTGSTRTFRKSDTLSLTNGRFEHTFTDPNRTGAPGGPSATLYVNARTGASGNRREIGVEFYIISNNLKIITLEENRGNK